MILVVSLSSAIQAQTNLVQDGDFTQTNTTGVHTTGATTNGGQLSYNIGAVGWTNTPASNQAYNNAYGYNFLFTTNSFDNTNGVAGNAGNFNLWSTNYAGGHGTLSSPPTNAFFPTPGNFLAADGAYQTSNIRQTITSLVAGQQYLLDFQWAVGQQYRNSFTSSVTAQWNVSLGDSLMTTPVYTNNPGQTVSPWMDATAVFTASNSSEILSFLASGTPNGQPPFALLGDVSLVAVPEPSQVASSILLLACMAGFLVYRRQKAARSA